MSAPIVLVRERSDVMSFADDQVKNLQKPPNRRWIKQREIDGKVFPYLEGWRAIAEANRIFGFVYRRKASYLPISRTLRRTQLDDRWKELTLQ